MFLGVLVGGLCMNYTDANRGIIQYKDRARQLIDFQNLRIGKITPTDTDGEIEYHNKAWIFIEIKYKDAEMGDGQRIAFERKVNDIERGGKKAVLFVAHHYVDDPMVDVDAGACIVKKIFYKNKWWSGDGNDLKSFVNRFVGMVDGLAIEKEA